MPCPSREALEIAYNLGEAMSIWLFSLDYLFLAVGFGVSAYLSLRYPLIPAWHGVLGALNALLCLAAFALEVAQVANSAIFTAFAVGALDALVPHVSPLSRFRSDAGFDGHLLSCVADLAGPYFCL